MAEERGYYQLEEQPAFKEQVERLLNSDEVRAEGSQFESLLLSMLNNIKAAYQKAGSVADGVGKPGGAASLDETGKVPASQLPPMDYVPNSEKGAAGGVATLDSSGKLKEAQKPAYTAADVGAIATPAGGTTGQVLTKTDGGAAWGDAPQTGITQEQADARYLQLSGGTISGPVTMNNVFKVYDGYIDAVQITSSEGNLILGASSVVTLAPTAKTISVSNSRIINVATPTSNTDAANKDYVDQQVVAAGGVVTGTYTGNGDETSGYTVNLGFKPKAVIIWATDGTSGGNGNIPFSDGGIILDTQPIQSGSTIHAEIVNEGFKVYTVESNNRPSYNDSKLQHTYIAFK